MNIGISVVYLYFVLKTHRPKIVVVHSWLKMRYLLYVLAETFLYPGTLSQPLYLRST
jgi:hypothetical protein